VKNKLLTLAGALALLAVLGTYYAKPLLAQVRAALVSDVDNPARGFVQLSFLAVLPPGFQTEVLRFDPKFVVPAGKRLVIDMVSASTSTLQAGVSPRDLWIVSGSSPSVCAEGIGLAPVVMMPLTYEGTDYNDGPEYGGLARTQAYIDTAMCLAVEINHNQPVNDMTAWQVAISGHLVTLP
jgi:hypothetical protein